MTTTPTTETHGLLARVEANVTEVRRGEFERLVLAREWALAHVVTDPNLLADPRRRPTPLGAVSLPVCEYAAAEFAAALGLHPLAGRRLMADGVDIHDRLPHTWAALDAGRLDLWVARKIAAATADLTDRAGATGRRRRRQRARHPPARPAPRRSSTARVVEADQALADRKAEEAAAARTVWMSRHDEHGTRTLVVRGDEQRRTPLPRHRRPSGTPARSSTATPTSAAASIDELRADAVGLLANPLAALKLHGRCWGERLPRPGGRRRSEPPDRTRCGPRPSSTCT